MRMLVPAVLHPTETEETPAGRVWHYIDIPLASYPIPVMAGQGKT